MKKHFLFVLLAAFAIKANAQNNFQRTAKGTEYRILNNNPGDKIKVNDVITFEVVEKTEKDSILFSTYVTGRPAQAQIQPTGDLMDIFPLLALKDSVLIKEPTDSIFKNNEDKRPPFLPKGSNLLFVLKIERIQTLAEAMAEREKTIAEGKNMLAKYQADEATATEKYIADNKLLLKTTSSGIKYKITRPSLKRKPLLGDTVLVNYVGRGLDGKIFDTSVAAEGMKAGLQRPAETYQPYQVVIGHGEVIPGWEEALQLMNEGSKATFVIPSKLAYGENGSGETIKPFSTLLFDLELVKVKPTKHSPVKTTGAKTAAKSAAKPPVKKPAAVKKKS